MKKPANLKDIPKHMRTKEWIESEIRYEQADGIHTYHQCDCGRKSCRSTMCDLCWKELLSEQKD